MTDEHDMLKDESNIALHEAARKLPGQMRPAFVDSVMAHIASKKVPTIKDQRKRHLKSTKTLLRKSKVGGFFLRSIAKLKKGEASKKGARNKTPSKGARSKTPSGKGKSKGKKAARQQQSIKPRAKPSSGRGRGRGRGGRKAAVAQEVGISTASSSSAHNPPELALGNAKKRVRKSLPASKKKKEVAAEVAANEAKAAEADDEAEEPEQRTGLISGCLAMEDLKVTLPNFNGPDLDGVMMCPSDLAPQKVSKGARNYTVTGANNVKVQVHVHKQQYYVSNAEVVGYKLSPTVAWSRHGGPVNAWLWLKAELGWQSRDVDV